MKMKKLLFLLWLGLALLYFSSAVLAVQTNGLEDVQVANGLDLGQLLHLGSGLLALTLFILTLIAYQRNKNRRLVYVSVAFFLAALEGFLISSQLFFGDWPWIEPIVSVVSFAMLLSFFFGILKK